MHNEKWTSAELLHAEFIIASQRSSKSSRRPSSLSVTTQEPNSLKNESCKHLAKIRQPPHTDPLEDYRPHMLLPLLSIRTKKVWRHRGSTRSQLEKMFEQGRRWSWVVQTGLKQNRGAVQPELVKWRHHFHHWISQQQLWPRMNVQNLQWMVCDASLHFLEAWSQTWSSLCSHLCEDHLQSRATWGSSRTADRLHV